MVSEEQRQYWRPRGGHWRLQRAKTRREPRAHLCGKSPLAGVVILHLRLFLHRQHLLVVDAHVEQPVNHTGKEDVRSV